MANVSMNVCFILIILQSTGQKIGNGRETRPSTKNAGGRLFSRWADSKLQKKAGFSPWARNPAFSQTGRFPDCRKKPGFSPWARNPAFFQTGRLPDCRKKPGFFSSIIPTCHMETKFFQFLLSEVPFIIRYGFWECLFQIPKVFQSQGYCEGRFEKSPDSSGLWMICLVQSTYVCSMWKGERAHRLVPVCRQKGKNLGIPHLPWFTEDEPPDVAVVCIRVLTGWLALCMISRMFSRCWLMGSK